MSIVYLVPGNMTGGPYGLKELKRREKLLKDWSFNPSKVKVYDVPNGGSSIESSYEEIASIIPAVDRLSEITKYENIDAVILGCFGDPGLDVFREMFDFPIIGPAQTSMHTACQLGHKFSVITIFDSMLNMAEKQVHEYGLDHHLASVRAINIPVLELLKDLDVTYKKMSKLFHTKAGINNPLIVKNITPNIGSAFSGKGNALKAAKYQKKICKSRGIFLKNST